MERDAPPPVEPDWEWPTGWSCLHFVGFRGDEYARAVRVFGPPDFIHRHNDPRFRLGGELGEHDVVVFANGSEAKVSRYSFNDSEVF